MFLSFPPPTKMFQFRGLAHFRVLGLLPSGLSIRPLLLSYIHHNPYCSYDDLISSP